MVCALCEEEKELQDSHLIPRGVYKKVMKAHDSKLIKATMDEKNIRYDGRHLTHHLLCSDCEQALNNGGEKTIIPLLFDKDNFPLLDQVRSIDGYSDDGEFVTIDFELIESHWHFFVGYCWKESVFDWHMKGEDDAEPSVYLSLEPFHREIQDYLLGAGALPGNFRMALIVYRDAGAQNGTGTAAISRDLKWYNWIAPGIRYELYTDDYPPKYAELFRDHKQILICRNYAGSGDESEFLAAAKRIQPVGSFLKDLKSGLYDNPPDD